MCSCTCWHVSGVWYTWVGCTPASAVSNPCVSLFILLQVLYGALLADWVPVFCTYVEGICPVKFTISLCAMKWCEVNPVVMPVIHVTLHENVVVWLMGCPLCSRI